MDNLIPVIKKMIESNIDIKIDEHNLTISLVIRNLVQKRGLLEQSDEIKKQLLKQIEKWPEQQKIPAQQQIEAMNPEQLEEFLVKNKLIKQGDCVFCSIVKGESPSYKIDENNEAIAILDINPVSEGHTLILPKKHEQIENSQKTLELAHKTANKLKETLSVEEIKIESANLQGHGMINVIPVYKGEKPERKQAKPEELAELKKKLETKPESKKEKPKPRKIKIKELPKAPIRIP